MVLVHTYCVCGGKRNVYSRLGELLGGPLEARRNGITKDAAALCERNVRSGYPLVGIDGALLGHVGVCFGDGSALLFDTGDGLVQKSVLLLCKEV